QLHPEAGGGNSTDDVPVFPLAVLSPVQVHHVDVPGPGGQEGFGGGQRVVGHLVDGGEVPLVQPHHGPVLQVDGGEDQHVPTPSQKARRMFSPTEPLFSGWNWTPSTLSRPTAAVSS